MKIQVIVNMRKRRKENTRKNFYFLTDGCLLIYFLYIMNDNKHTKHI